MIDDVFELFLQIVDGFSLLHTKHFVLLDQGVPTCPFYIVYSFMSHSQNFPHLTCTSADRNPVKFIKGQSK